MGLVMTAVFVGFLLLLGWALGIVVQKSNSIWGAVLALAVADALFVIAVFGV